MLTLHYFSSVKKLSLLYKQTSHLLTIQRQLSDLPIQLLCSDMQRGEIVHIPPRGNTAMSGDIFDCHN